MGILEYMGLKRKPDTTRAITSIGNITTSEQLAEALQLYASDVGKTDYLKNYNEGYMSNPYVAACIQKKVTAAKEPKWELWYKGRQIEKKPNITSPLLPLWNILFEKHFVTGCYWDDIVEQNIIYKDLAGEYFLHMPDIAATKRGNGYLTFLEPNQVVINPSNYEIKEGTRVIKTIPKEITVDGIKINPVLHKYNWNKGKDRGLSRLASAFASVEITNVGAKWNYNLLKNGARPSFLMMFDSTGLDMTAEKWHKVNDKIKEFSGGDNAGKTLALQAGPNTKISEMGLNAKDMDFLNLIEICAKNIALALGVPGVLLGFKGDSTYSNFESANEVLMTQTIMPELEAFRLEVEGWFRNIVPDIELKINYDDVLALSKVKNLDLDYKLKMSPYLSRNEMRELLGYEPEDNNDSNDNNNINNVDNTNNQDTTTDINVDNNPDTGNNQ